MYRKGSGFFSQYFSQSENIFPKKNKSTTQSACVDKETNCDVNASVETETPNTEVTKGE